MSNRSDPVLLNPDPTWIKSSRSQIRIHNTGTINMFILYFSGMYACTTVPFKVSPSPLLSISSNISYHTLPPEDRRSQPALHCLFYRKLFTVMFSNVFFPSMMRLFLSLLQGAVIFFYFQKKRNLQEFGYFKLKCQGIHERVGLKTYLFLILVKIVINWSVFGQISLRINRKFNKFWVIKITAP